MRVRAILAAALLLGPTPALAGKDHVATDTTRELACWAADYAANERARRHGTCYRACKPSACQDSGGRFTCRANSSNHAGSCGKSGKTDPVATANFRAKPGAAPIAQVQPAAGSNQVTHWPDPSNGNGYYVRIQNTGGQPASTCLRVTAQNMRYPNQPRTTALDGRITVQPGAVWQQGLHVWESRGTWQVQHQAC